MEQILAQTQAELEQEGWIFDVTEQPDIPAKNVYRFVVEGASSITVGQTDEQMPPLFHYLADLANRGPKWVEERYGTIYPVDGYLRYEGSLYKLVQFTRDAPDDVETLTMRIAAPIKQVYRNGLWVPLAKILEVEWNEFGSIRIVSRYEKLYVPTLIVFDTDDYIGDLDEVLDALDNNLPYEIKVENAAGNVTYTCTQTYRASPTRISFYAHFEKSGVIKTIEVRINPETGYVEVRR